MNRREQELFWHLCRFLDPCREEIAQLLCKGAGTPEVLGHLLYNRMGAVAHHVLMKTETADCATREFRNTLRDVWLQGVEKNRSFVRGKDFVAEILESSGAEYALLKGAYLCDLYPAGCRTANDVDILTEGKWLTPIGQALAKAGFRQGRMRNREFIPATREDVICAKMLRGETMPYILEVNFPYMQYLEVDLNFSLDYKNTADPALHAFVHSTKMHGACRILDSVHFLLHLCAHLYKEATTYPWVQMGRDMSLYKFCDLYLLLYTYTLQDYDLLGEKAKEYGMLSQCYYALEATRVLLQIEDPMLLGFLARICPADSSVMDRVLDPSTGRKFLYKETNLRRRFFAKNREALLEEVRENGKR
ncbi:MAG: nucleotidyltransferase family protein [Clostridiales bacterium]|nr:nucleotidyltransferase family protein [Clostridiales bacterium]